MAFTDAAGQRVFVDGEALAGEGPFAGEELGTTQKLNWSLRASVSLASSCSAAM